MKPSDRQLEVLQAVADGKSVPEIALALGLSEFTVKTHIRDGMVKLDAHSRAHAVALAFRQEWIT